MADIDTFQSVSSAPVIKSFLQSFKLSKSWHVAFTESPYAVINAYVNFRTFVGPIRISKTLNSVLSQCLSRSDALRFFFCPSHVVSFEVYYLLTSSYLFSGCLSLCVFCHFFDLVGSCLHKLVLERNCFKYLSFRTVSSSGWSLASSAIRSNYTFLWTPAVLQTLHFSSWSLQAEKKIRL